jgi:lipopolysaccharide transport system ATP-binding protein
VGDDHFQAKCWRQMREWLGTGASGILVTHDWSAVLKLCEECHIMERGRIVQTGPSSEIVRSYLDLPRTNFSTIVRIDPSTPRQYTARAGEDFEFTFDVEITRDIPGLAAAYSIEFLWVGTGWEIALIGNNIPVPCTAGRHSLCLKISRLPVVPGRYTLNLFLSSPMSAEEKCVAIAYDAWGWTYGNGIDLVVTGQSRSGVSVLPWECEGVEVGT